MNPLEADFKRPFQDHIRLCLAVHLLRNQHFAPLGLFLNNMRLNKIISDISAIFERLINELNAS